jgi:hypothetical protein
MGGFNYYPLGVEVAGSRLPSLFLSGLEVMLQNTTPLLASNTLDKIALTQSIKFHKSITTVERGNIEQVIYFTVKLKILRNFL